jgi:predicted transposase/invertase (TIGR01784 family)
LPPEGQTPRIVFFTEVQFQRDESLYHRFFTESFLYLHRNQTLYDDWYGVLIFPSRKLEPTHSTIHRALINSDQVQRIYLNELGDPNQQPIGLRLMQLTIATKPKLINQAKQLIQQAEQGRISLPRTDIIEMVTTIATYKYAKLSREEVEAMLDIKLTETRFYQDAKSDGRKEMCQEMLAKTVPLLLNAGMTLEQIAQQLQMDLSEVQKAAEPKENA